MCLDNFQVGCPKWLKELSDQGSIELHEFNKESAEEDLIW